MQKYASPAFEIFFPHILHVCVFVQTQYITNQNVTSAVIQNPSYHFNVKMLMKAIFASCFNHSEALSSLIFSYICSPQLSRKAFDHAAPLNKWGNVKVTWKRSWTSRL